jgi:hypothetical protein
MRSGTNQGNPTLSTDGQKGQETHLKHILACGHLGDATADTLVINGKRARQAPP